MFLEYGVVYEIDFNQANWAPKNALQQKLQIDASSSVHLFRYID